MGSHIPTANEDLRKRILWLEYRVTKLEKDLASMVEATSLILDMTEDDGR